MPKCVRARARSLPFARVPLGRRYVAVTTSTRRTRCPGITGHVPSNDDAALSNAKSVLKPSRRGGRRTFPIARIPRAIELRTEIGDPPRPILSSTSFRRAFLLLIFVRNLRIPIFLQLFAVHVTCHAQIRSTVTFAAFLLAKRQILLPLRMISLSLSLSVSQD